MDESYSVISPPVKDHETEIFKEIGKVNLDSCLELPSGKFY